MNTFLCVRIGNSGLYQQFVRLDNAIAFLNKQKVGQVERWIAGTQPGVDRGLIRGFTTSNLAGPWYVRMYWGDPTSNYRAPLDENDRLTIEHDLEERIIPAKLKEDRAYLWARVGDCGEYEICDDLDAAIEYLNELSVGKVTCWVRGGFETQNYHGHDYVSVYYGDREGNHVSDIGENEDEAQVYHRQYVECNLERNEL